MRLRYGWRASFSDATHTITLHKPSRNMRVLLAWSPEQPYLRVLDLITRMPTPSYTHQLPEDVRGVLLEAALARWGA